MSTIEGSEDAIAVPTAILAMLILLMLGGLFVSYGVSGQRQTRQTQAFEGGLHVAETAAELGLAALADPNQTDRPYEPASSAPADPDAAKQWAIDQALTQVSAGCGNFKTTAGGDGIAVVDESSGTVYGVAFLPDCQTRNTTRVLRLDFDSRPTNTYASVVTILTGGDVHFDGNASIVGGLHANGSVVGGPHQASGGSISAGGNCSGAHATCQGNAPIRNIPNYSARKFWDVRDQPLVNPHNDPFYELCPDGLVRINSTEVPCDGTVVPKPHPAWSFQTSYSYPNTTLNNRNWGPTWVWNANHGPPDAIYYGYRTNIVTHDNSGMGTVGRFTVLAEANLSAITSNGAHSGNIGFTNNPRFFASWTGVGVVADVDLVVDKNISAIGSATMVFAREQFQFMTNGKSDRMFYIACDAALTSTTYDPEASFCESNASLKSATNSPINTTRIRRNTGFDAPGEGTVVTPNLGITGVSAWEAL